MDHTRFATIPVYHWLGSRPALFDLPSDHTGWLACLCLQREGDLCFLPLAWERQQQTQDDERPSQHPPLPAFTSSALDSEAVALTIKNLQNSGWQINGRITIQFTGQETDENFHQRTQTYLWQKPTTKEIKKDEL